MSRWLRLLAVVMTAAVIGGLASLAAGVHATPAPSAAPMSTYGGQSGHTISLATDEARLASNDRALVYGAVDRWSQGSSPHSQASAPERTTAHATSALVTQMHAATGTTYEPAEMIEGDLSPPLRAGVAAKTGARACSFAGATLVLMADGAKRPIEEIAVGDEVIATDPETGEQVAKRVEHVFVHDDTVVDLVVDGEVITTTEDHPFWSVTDQRFERADELGDGEKVLGADSQAITVSGLEIGTAREALAYNLSVEGIHTYHVGERGLLVHNTCADDLEGLAHVRGRHLPGGADVDDLAGVFDGGVDLAGLARGSAGTVGKYPATGNVEYAVRSKSIIGTTGRDRLPTNTYTIVRNPYGELVTMHPGSP